jgi:hypothetical protein
MTRQVVKRLTSVAGLTLLLASGVVLALHAAPSQPQDSRRAAVGAPVTTPTVTLTTPTGATSPIPTPSQAPTATLTLSPVQALSAWFSTNWPLAAVLCLIPLLILGLVCVLWILRRKPRAVPSPPPPPPPPRPVPARAHLESAAPGGSPRLFDLKPQGVTIGRGQENDLVITEDFPGWETVSHHHARVYEQGGRWIVEDLDSMNGIYVNGKRTGHNLLREGWRLGVGGVEFIFHAGVGEART